ncbi:hypothetical protein LTR70_007432 [Exophiala xenobiotica]|uniref:Uncharacterized protein n=1 Tax=Lithohypha guttulata TaxID=1690604 RepID=A0ABR0K5A1_9EURO|nr:hypothetical protein LTR24_006972 [Lithohypha guttulata]KAK5313789.1 hypothetical protein LTR70_007432 [Exophiala xenobiotica]
MLEAQLHNPRKRRNPESQTLPRTVSSFHLCKKQKRDHNNRSRFPPAFWDNLSKIDLTTRALEEVDRRNTQAALNSWPTRRQLHRPLTRGILAESRKSLQPFIPAVDYLHRCGSKVLKSVKQTARHGGPDLSDLRGLSKHSTLFDQEMSSSQSSSRAPKRSSRSTSNTRPSTNTSTSKSSGPYNRNFQQNLIDGGVLPPAYRYPDGRLPKKPDNWEDIQRRLRGPRPSLSPSKFMEEDHEIFVQADADAAKEKQVTTSVIPIIEGNIGDAKCVSGGIPFTNLDPLTDGTLAPGNPDVYYGARPEQLDRRVRDELSGLIIPSTQHDLPVVPNFFLAAKGPDGSAAVAKRQAYYDGALGARGIHSLQFYCQESSSYDNNAYTISSVYHDGTLKMYTSHRHSTGPGSQPEYYAHQLNTWGMTGNVETFRQGAAAYRNARDWAKEQREEAIRQANRRASEHQAQSLTVETNSERNSSFTSETTAEGGFRPDEESQNLLDETSNTTAEFQDSDNSTYELAAETLPIKRLNKRSKQTSRYQRKRRNAGAADESFSDQAELQTSGPSGLSQQLEDQGLGQELESQSSNSDLQPIASIKP